MPISVIVEKFEGPLDLLIQLVERNQLEITGISAALVTEQFLAHLEGLEQDDPSELGDFLQLATRLVYIKSLALLPDTAGVDFEELRRLDHEMAAYRRYQQGAQLLRELAETQPKSRPRIVRATPQSFVAPVLDVATLADIFQQAIKSTPEPPQAHRQKSEISLAQMQTLIRQQTSTSGIDLQTLIANCQDRAEIIVLFLALLELIRQGEFEAIQPTGFGPAMVVRNA